MLSEVKRKKLILDNRKPHSVAMQKKIRDINRVDFIWSIAVPAGMADDKKTIRSILHGEYLPEVSLEKNIFIRNLSASVHLAEQFAAMPATINLPLIHAAYEALSQGEKKQYRVDNSMPQDLQYKPPDFKLIHEQMELFINWLNEPERDRDPIKTAVGIHSRMIEMYPFHSHNESLAIWLMQYHLMTSGLPTVDLFQEKMVYYTMLNEYIMTQDMLPLAKVISDIVSAKMEYFIRLTEGQN